MSNASLPRVLYVLNVNPADKFGSMEEQIVFLNRAFRAEESDFVPLFTFPPQPGSTDALQAHGVNAYCLDLMRFRLATFGKLWRLLGQERIDIVHWNMTSPLKNPYLWGLTFLRPRVRHFYTDHNSRDEQPYAGPLGWRKAVKRFLLKRYRQVWCVSQYVQDCLAEQDTWSNLRCCRHFINTDRFRPDPVVRATWRGRYGVEDRFVVMVVAQLISAKGVDLALRALVELPDKVVLWIVGTGDRADELKALAGTLGVEDQVTFWGLQRNVEPFLQAADCLVLPSRWREAAGLVVLEAQAAGLPVVASRTGGIPEYVDEGRTGLLFSPEDAAGLAAHLGSLCRDAGLSSRMGAAALSLARERFSVESRLPNFLSFYRGTC
jgi:glycosyltransferase involved in cell wall biosynthesis